MRPRGYKGSERAAVWIAVAVALALPYLFIAALVMASGCVTGPDGRRVLSPGARAAGAAVLEDVLACGAPLLLGALSGSPDYLAASTCHLGRVGARIGRAIEAAPVPSEDHGRDVIRAAVLEHDGHTKAAKMLADECEETARARLAGEAVQP